MTTHICFNHMSQAQLSDGLPQHNLQRLCTHVRPQLSHKAYPQFHPPTHSLPLSSSSGGGGKHMFIFWADSPPPSATVCLARVFPVSAWKATKRILRARRLGCYILTHTVCLSVSLSLSLPRSSARQTAIHGSEALAVAAFARCFRPAGLWLQCAGGQDSRAPSHPFRKDTFRMSHNTNRTIWIGGKDAHLRRHEEPIVRRWQFLSEHAASALTTPALAFRNGLETPGCGGPASRQTKVTKLDVAREPSCCRCWHLPSQQS